MSAGTDQGSDATDWKTRREQMKALGMQVLWNALQIADDAVRSDVELYAKGIAHSKGFTVYDLTRAEPFGAESEEEQQRCVDKALRAARYIDLRGDIFPWHMVRVDGAGHMVRFINKEPAE
ncbi:hypothetical protein [Pseudoxanthomonas mexicana]|uniref:hypothetical protein n=1 Tax=Pseudoxanthomonas mexicana TaxID=128785 RepID=UPI00398B2ADE